MNMPDQVSSFVAALIANAKRIEGWEVCNLRDGKCFADTVVYVKRLTDGSWQVCDNYEKFFSAIYLYKDGEWSIRHMYSELPAKPFDYYKCMLDADIMFTG